MARATTTRWTRLGRWVRLHLLRSLRENASPARTALGLGLGAFIGIFPTFMIGTPLAFFVAGRVGLNRAAAVAGTVLAMNPITGPFLYSLSAWLGFELLNREQIEREAQGLMGGLWGDYMAPFLLGSAVVAFTVAVVLATAMFIFVRQRGGLRTLLIKPKTYKPQPPRPTTAEPVESAHIPTAP
jgi:uncharacterized protein (DUF2062 family)